jgi:hypothetical protein
VIRGELSNGQKFRSIQRDCAKRPKDLSYPVFKVEGGDLEDERKE